MSYRNVVAVLALVLALGGGSAVALTGHNRVFSDDIVDGQVRNADLGKSSVTGPKVKNLSLGVRDLRSVFQRVRGGEITTPDGSFGSSKPYSLSGATWTQGAADTNLIFGDVVLRAPATCDAGMDPFFHTQAGVVGLNLDGHALGTAGANFPATGPGGTARAAFALSYTGEMGNGPLIPAPGQPTTHTLTASIADDCGQSGENWTVKRLRVDVIAAR